MKTFKKLISLLCIMILCSCNDSESNPISKDAPKLTVKLVDEPGDFEAVNVEVVDVMIKMNDDEDDDNGWISLEVDSKIINLLELTGGVNEVLVDRFPIPTGTLKQMRLVLGDGNTIVIKNEADEDEEHSLKTPSGQQSGLKLKVDAVIEEGFTYDYIIDFDVEKSIVNAGNSGNIILKPVLYVSTEVTSGIIEGMVLPSDIPSVVSVLIDDMGTEDTEDDFIITANTDENGAFALWGVPEGTYDVVVTPIDSNSFYKQTVLADVIVVNGDVTIIEPPIELDFKVGSITGKILNENVVVTVSIEIDGNTFEVDTNEEGVFLLENIPIGVYKVTLTPAEGSGLAVVEMNNEEVKEDEINDLGEITLPSV